MRKAPVYGIDLFCGAGGLAFGLQKAGVSIVAGIDLDPTSEFPFKWNNHAPFIRADVRNLNGDDLSKALSCRCNPTASRLRSLQALLAIPSRYE